MQQQLATLTLTLTRTRAHSYNHSYTPPAMAFIEIRFVLEGAALPFPDWLCPHTSPGDVVYALHRFYPAYMQAGR